MPNFTASVVIAHPARVVWDYIIHPDNISNVLPGIVSVDAGKEPPYVPGDLWHGVSRSFGITDNWTGIFVRVDAPRVMEFRIAETRWKGSRAAPATPATSLAIRLFAGRSVDCMMQSCLESLSGYWHDTKHSFPRISTHPCGRRVDTQS